MHARVVSVQFRAGKLEDAVSIWKESVMGAARQRPGFRGLLVMTNQETGKAISMTLWDTVEDMKSGERSSYYQEQVTKFAEVMAGPPVLEHYEISIQA